MFFFFFQRRKKVLKLEKIIKRRMWKILKKIALKIKIIEAVRS